MGESGTTSIIGYSSGTCKVRRPIGRRRGEGIVSGGKRMAAHIANAAGDPAESAFPSSIA
jgi:hypothetical protein